jgi:hypothetical protein
LAAGEKLRECLGQQAAAMRRVAVLQAFLPARGLAVREPQ